MTVNLITFIDPADEETQEINTNDFLQKSINFVNEHGGWTDNYRYVGLDKRRKRFFFVSMDLMVILSLEKIVLFLN